MRKTRRNNRFAVFFHKNSRFLYTNSGVGWYNTETETILIQNEV